MGIISSIIAWVDSNSRNKSDHIVSCRGSKFQPKSTNVFFFFCNATPQTKQDLGGEKTLITMETDAACLKQEVMCGFCLYLQNRLALDQFIVKVLDT